MFRSEHKKEVVVANRLGLLIAIGMTMLLACGGVALAQATEPGSGREELAASASSLEAGEVIPNHYIVVLDEDVASPASVARDLSGRLDFETTNVYDDALNGFAAEIQAGDLSTVRSNPSVEFVARDRVIEASGQTTPTGTDRVDADASSTLAGNGGGAVDADVAILDSGIYRAHSDLNIAGGYNCVSRNREAWSDGSGHGTHVAGTAAAEDNEIGTVGIAPGARLWSVKVLNRDGSGTFSSAICGIDWITGKDANSDGTSEIEVANMSLGATVTGADDTGCGWTGNSAANALNQAVCQSDKLSGRYSIQSRSPWSPMSIRAR